MTNLSLLRTPRKPRDFYAPAIPLVFGRDRCAPKKDAADVAEKSKELPAPPGPAAARHVSERMEAPARWRLGAQTAAHQCRREK